MSRSDGCSSEIKRRTDCAPDVLIGKLAGRFRGTKREMKGKQKLAQGQNSVSCFPYRGWNIITHYHKILRLFPCLHPSISLYSAH